MNTLLGYSRQGSKLTGISCVMYELYPAELYVTRELAAWDNINCLYVLLQLKRICKIRGARWKNSSVFRRKQWDVRGDSQSSHPPHKFDNRLMDQSEELGGTICSLWRLVFSLAVSIVYWPEQSHLCPREKWRWYLFSVVVFKVDIFTCLCYFFTCRYGRLIHLISGTSGIEWSSKYVSRHY